MRDISDIASLRGWLESSKGDGSVKDAADDLSRPSLPVSIFSFANDIKRDPEPGGSPDGWIPAGADDEVPASFERYGGADGVG
jgi:hypothetical protein